MTCQKFARLYMHVIVVRATETSYMTSWNWEHQQQQKSRKDSTWFWPLISTQREAEPTMQCDAAVSAGWRWVHTLGTDFQAKNKPPRLSETFCCIMSRLRGCLLHSGHSTELLRTQTMRRQPRVRTDMNTSWHVMLLAKLLISCSFLSQLRSKYRGRLAQFQLVFPVLFNCSSRFRIFQFVFKFRSTKQTNERHYTTVLVSEHHKHSSSVASKNVNKFSCSKMES